MDEIESPHSSSSQSLARTSPIEAIQDQVWLDASPEVVPHLLDYWQVVLKRRWTVLSCLLVVFFTVAIATLKQRAIYQGKLLVEVNPEPPNTLNLKEVLQIGSSVDIETYRATKIKVLQSRILAEHVVKNLKLYRNPEFYRTRVLFGLIERNPKKIPAADNAPPDAASDAFYNAVQHFQNSLEVKPVPRTSLIEMSFYSEDPRLAMRIANQLASEYINENRKAKWDEAQGASEWLSNQLVGLKAKLEKSEDALQAYARANSIVFIGEKQNLVNARLEALEAEYTRGQANRIEKEALYRLVEAGKSEELPGVYSDKLIQGSEEHLADLRREYAKLSTTMKPDYPRAVQLQKQIDSIETSLKRRVNLASQNIVSEYKAALNREKGLAQALEDQKKEVNQVAERSIQYNILKRAVDTDRQLYEALLQRLKESQVSESLKASNISIVEPAEVPKAPVKPRILLNLALGFILGLGGGIGLAFFLDYLDKTVKTPDEVESLLRLPSLGVLPKFSLNGAVRSATETETEKSLSTQEPSAPAIQTNPAALEAYRSLRTSILLSAQPVPRLILITSALPGEGKTTTAVNLGATLASLGSSVVIVDCDMRRPACHRSTGVKNSPGFVQCLTGNVKLEDALLKVPGTANLSVIPCGPIPPNPAEVLSSPLAGELLRNLRKGFDYVLVDSPPLLSVADSRILATMTDAVAMVVRAYSTPYDVVRRAKALLYGAGARILGVALNDVDFRRDGYGYSYYYRYGYGYGYGTESSEDTDDQERA